MAGLILKSPYIKGGGAGKYMKYIATRENVERLPDARPPTRKQMGLVQKLTRDFPASTKSDEYAEYNKALTRAKASAYISSTLEANWDTAQRSDVYMKYIATRPRVEKLGTHGLFGDEDDVNLDAAITEMETVTGNVWTHIISLKREDAERLGYDNASSWRNLLRAHRNDIAEAMRIAPNDFRWYAAFHNEGDHPHIHMMAWSASGEGYLSKDGIRKIKSELVNDIFKQELLHTYEQKSSMRDELVNEARQSLQNLVSEIRDGLCACPQIAPMLTELSMDLGTVKGKKTYGYLKKNLKDKVNKIVDKLKLYQRYTNATRSGSTCKQRWTVTTRMNAGNACDCPSKKSSAPSRTRSYKKRSVCGWARSQLRRCLLARWTSATGVSNATSAHTSWTRQCLSTSATRQWNKSRSTLMRASHRHSMCLACSTATAVCSCRTR